LWIYIFLLVYSVLLLPVRFENSNFPMNFKPFMKVVIFFSNQKIDCVTALLFFGEIVFNILIFVPLHFFLYSFSKKNIKFIYFLLGSLLLSITIEISQKILNLGVFDIDDIIFNVSGAITGYFLVQKFCRKVSLYKQFFKRGLDFILALLLGVILLPLFFFVLFIQLLLSDRIFFVQKRIGENYQEFNMYKFSVINGKPHYVKDKLTHEYSTQMNSWGRFLNRTKINELPQLFNVLKGEMSIVGPRPLPKSLLEEYDTESAMKIYTQKPGITGLGSIAFKDESVILHQISQEGGDAWDFFKRHIIPKKTALELTYLQRVSFFFDVKIIFFTIFNFDVKSL